MHPQSIKELIEDPPVGEALRSRAYKNVNLEEQLSRAMEECKRQVDAKAKATQGQREKTIIRMQKRSNPSKDGPFSSTHYEGKTNQPRYT